MGNGDTMSWTIKITKVVNGYIIEHGDDRDTEVIGETEPRGWTAVDYRDGESKSNSESAVTLAYEIWEYFALTGSKYDKFRPHAEVEQGHCYMDPDEKEEDKDDD